jgi:putative flavoprotein involved in K+ transport
MTDQPCDVIVIGGGQAGLAVGYHLKRRGVRFLILDAHPRVGDAWRKRWDSLRLFSPARYDGLDGMPFPGDPDAFPTKDEMADYLEAYAARFELPILNGVTVERLARDGDGFIIEAGDRRFEAKAVIVAMASYQKPRIPAFARALAPSIVQIHGADYKSPAQLGAGDVLVVGAANSGAEIAMDLAGTRTVTVSGRHPGHIPFSSTSFARKLLIMFLFRFVFHRLLRVTNRIGRKLQKKPHGATPLIRQKPRDLARAGIVRVGRTVDARDGLPVLDDGRTLAVANVIWCTGYHPGFAWIDLPIFGEDGAPKHDSGVATDQPGLYFVGLHFLHAFSSAMIHGVGRDANRIAELAANQARARYSVTNASQAASWHSVAATIALSGDSADATAAAVSGGSPIASA